LPDPTWPLSKKVPSKAIATVNKRMTEVLEKPLKSGRGPYLTLMPAQNLAVIFLFMVLCTATV